MSQELSEATRDLVRSRIPDYYGLTQEEQAIAALKVIKDDFYIYCERNLVIQDKTSGELVTFKPNWAQRILIDLVMEDIKNGVPVRYIILKARQMGFSTVIEALAYWWTTTHRNIRTIIMAHETEASTNLYNMFKRYFDNCHKFFQPIRKYNNKKELVFDVDDATKEDYKKDGKKSPGLNSEIKTLVAREGKGRGSTTHFFHGSECAFWENQADVTSAALQSIPLAANTFAFIESTANGVGGYFYDEWQFAKKGESAFKPLFFPWHSHHEYEIPGEVSNYNDEELELLKIFEEKEYPKESWNRKILWRRAKMKEFRSDPKKFYQEYPKDDMEAFLSSGRPVFDTANLVKMEQIAQKIQPMFGNIIPNPDSSSHIKYIFDEVAKLDDRQDPTPLKVWDLVEKGEKYCIGVDVSEGKIAIGGNKDVNDWSVVTVIRQKDLKTVARWRGHIDPDLLGGVVFSIGTYYNTALVGVEVNNHGLTTVQHLRNKFYRNLYMRETNEENQFQERTSLMGWRTDRKTKPIIINNLVQALRENDIIDLDIVFIRECMTYIRDDQGHTNAQEGMYDDTVIATAIALQMTDFNSINVQYAKDNIYKPVKRNYNARGTTLESIATGRTRNQTNYEKVQKLREQRAAHRRTRR